MLFMEIMVEENVSSNVVYGDNGRGKYSQKDIEQAIDIAQGTEFVSKMKNTYKASIAQGGTNVSGGQKQRLSIARAICRKPKIYIFDDSFSALDYKTDRKLRSILKKETKGSTNLIVAQRIGTIIDADKIMVLDEGQIVGMGTHEELMKNCKVYQEIAYSQLSKDIIDADKIMVLDEGQIVGMGTHEELMKNCKVYQEIAYSQLSKEELA